MTAPLSMDLRVRVVRMVATGHSIRAAARRFEVSPSAAIKLMARVRATGDLAPLKIGGRRRPLLEPYADLLHALVAAKSDITLAEIRDGLQAHGVAVAALSTIHRMLRRLGLRVKKRRSGRPSRTAPT